jgi:hypothetical protein
LGTEIDGGEVAERENGDEAVRRESGDEGTRRVNGVEGRARGIGVGGERGLALAEQFAVTEEAESSG